MKTRKMVDDNGKARRVHAVPSACGKLAYSSRKYAKQMARLKSIESGELIEAYRCPKSCHAFHIGHPPGSRPDVDRWAS